MRGIRAISFAAGLLATTALAVPAFAQSGWTYPQTRTVDENNIDLNSGEYLLSFEEAAIGSGDARLPLVRASATDATRAFQWDYIRFDRKNFPAMGKSNADVNMSNRTATRFTAPFNTNTFAPDYQFGEGLKVTANGYEYSASDGSTIAYDYVVAGTNLCPVLYAACALPPARIVFPSGNVVTFAYSLYAKSGGGVAYRIASISNTYGYSIAFAYQDNTTGGLSAPPAAWYVRSSSAFKKAGTTQFSISYAYPVAGTVDMTNPAGETWRFTSTSIKRPSEASPGFVVTNPGNVTSVVRDGVTVNYAKTFVSPVTTMTKTNSLGQTNVFTFTGGRMASFKDGLNRTTSYLYTTGGALSKKTYPEGNYVQYTRDSRGNATTTTSVAKPGSGLADIVTSATFDATCTNKLTCNQPNTVTDQRGNVTDFTYDATHGGVLTITSPAPSVGAVRPQARYSYTAVGGIYSLTGVSACATGSAPSCLGTPDESKSSAVYDSAGNKTSGSASDGTGTLIATTAMTYDGNGDLLTVDGPLAGTDDTTRYRYDAARRLVGIIGPNPDGAGPLKHRATRNTYLPGGLLSKVERGTVNSQSDPDWAAFVPIETVDIGFDTSSRPVTKTLSGSSGAATLTQQSYDAAGRIECVATRMNTAAYGSLPASACSLGTTGSYGSDRVTKLVYDSAGKVTQLQIAVGTADATNEATFTYNNNGRVATVKDAENNLTTNEYDGFDRISKVRFPNTTKGSGTRSTTDFVQLTYDAASNITNERLRDAQNIGFTYDNLNRPTFKDLPGSEPDVTSAYDNLGRLTSASQTGNALSFTYDALDRNLTQVGPQGTVSSQWDIAGRRTRLTYPGSGLFLDYDYLVTNEMTKIRENGAISGIGVLATYGYDDLGRRTSLAFGNGASQAFGYDPVSRLASLTNNLTGSTNDLSQALSYNPANQIVTNVRTGDAYAWNGHYNENRNYTANGLNEYTASGAIAPTYDSKGNLTSAGTTTYAYSSENMLVSAIGGASASLSFDPGLRLYQVTSGANTTRFAYDGDDQIAEYDGSNNLLRRTVHGPGTDQPIVWYEGSGTTDRRFLSGDERGSIVSVSDASGNMLTINSYDEYGIPGTANAGRFQYTGQAWLPELGMYNYKARIYSPTLGRFLQTDPIGATNLYSYSGNDPVNFSDPSGGYYSRPDPSMPSEYSHKSLTPHSYDWMGGIGTYVNGRIEEGEIARDIAKFHELYGKNAPMPEEYWSCVKYCSGHVSGTGNDDTVVQPTPVGDWVELPAELAIRDFGWHGILKAIFSLGGDSCRTCNTNPGTVIDGVAYSKHALDRMEERGIYPSVVKNTILHGTRSPGRTQGTFMIYEKTNNITVIVNAKGAVITVYVGSTGK